MIGAGGNTCTGLAPPMSEPASVRKSEVSDGLGRALQFFDRLLSPLENLLNLFGGLLVFALMFLGVVQIFLRTVFRSPIFGYIDIVEFSMVGFALLAIAYVQRQGGHVRMELLVGRLRGRLLWIVESFGTLVTGAIVAILIPYSYKHFERAINFGDSTIDIELPTWPGKLLVPIALSILLLRLIIQFVGYLRLAYVPLIQSVAEQAEEEIEVAKADG